MYSTYKNPGPTNAVPKIIQDPTSVTILNLEPNSDTTKDPTAYYVSTEMEVSKKCEKIQFKKHIFKQFQ